MVLAPAAEISSGSVRRTRASLEAGRRLAGERGGAAADEDEGAGDDDEGRPDSEGEVEAEAGWALLRGPSSPEREEGAGKPPSPLVAPRGRRRGRGWRHRGAVEGEEEEEFFFFFFEGGKTW